MFSLFLKLKGQWAKNQKKDLSAPLSPTVWSLLHPASMLSKFSNIHYSFIPMYPNLKLTF